MTKYPMFLAIVLGSLLSPAALSASTLPASAVQENSAQSSIVAAAMPWQNQTFELGKAEQCMNWTRTVLQQACGAKFAAIQTEKPWDFAQLGPGDELKAEHADSLAGDEFGDKISSVDALQPGDLVFLQNTYGNWNKGVITHVGIATGDGNYIHRMTSNEGFVRIEPIPKADFHAGLRLKPEFCQ